MPKNSMRIKSKKTLKSTMNKKDANMLNDLFKKLIGAENAEPKILLPKYIKIKNYVRKFYKIYTLFLNFKDFRIKFKSYDKEFSQIEHFLHKLKTEFIDIDFDKQEDSDYDYKQLSKESLNLLYKKYTKSELLKVIIVISGNLREHLKYIGNRSQIEIGKSDIFIKREPGISFTPLVFTAMDFKKMWSSEKMTDMSKKYILNILSHTYDIGNNLYIILNSPNIDIAKFSNILVKEITKIRKRIPRCNEAFDIIQDSVNLLENNFEQYYRESIESENLSLIMENFISDVLTSQKTSSVLTHQFRKIIMYIKKLSTGNNDPMVQQLFKLLKSNFKLMEKYTPKEDISSNSNANSNTKLIDQDEITKDKEEYKKMFENIEEQEIDESLIHDIINTGTNQLNNPNNQSTKQPQ